MTTVLLSFWRTDVARDLEKRVEHLLAKGGRGVRWVWVVGDSSDDTEARLRELAHTAVTIVRHDTGIVGEDRVTRLTRFSRTADAGLAMIQPGDDRILMPAGRGPPAPRRPRRGGGRLADPDDRGPDDSV
jgi:hypothetical protein